MKIQSILIALWAFANLGSATELQQQYEKAYFLETAKGQLKQAVAIYQTIAEAEPTEENKETIKLSLMRMLAMAVQHENEEVIRECHAKLLQRVGATVQELVEVTAAGGTVHIPEGRFAGAVVIGKPVILKGANRNTSILELTGDAPLVYAPAKTEVTIESLDLGQAQIDLTHLTVSLDGRTEELGRFEADILRLLASDPGRVFTRDEILDRVWGIESFPTNRTIDNYIVKLRQKIEPDPKHPKHLLTVYGKGYKLGD